MGGSGSCAPPSSPPSHCSWAASGTSRSSSTPSSGRWPRTTTSGRCRCGRRAASSSTATARCWSRTAPPSTSRSCASTRTTSIAPCGLLAQVVGRDEQEMRDNLERHRREPTYRPIVMVQDASLAQVAAVTARRLDFELPDVVVQQVPTRRYPAQGLGAHLLGYVGEASEQQMGADGVPSGTVIGQSGLERTYNKVLMGEDGARRVVVNSVGREIRPLDKVEPVEGRRIQVTLDADMQRAAEEAFRHYGYWGSAAVLEPNSGDVLTMVSLPAYDPNAFASGIDRATWQALNTDELRPLQNRAIQGRYSPGSTFKIVVATAAIEEGVMTPETKVFCPGGANFYGRFFKCHLAGGHGWVDLRHAHREVVQRLLLHRRQPARRRQDPRLGRAPGAGREDRHRPAQRGREHHAVHAVEEAALRREVVRRRDDLGRDRPGPGVGHADVDGGDDGLGRQRQRGWRRGWSAPPPTARARPGSRPSCTRVSQAVTLKPTTVAAIHDGLWMAVNGAGTGRPGPHRRPRRGRQDRHRAGDLHPGPRTGPGQRQGPARPRLVRLHGAARQPRDWPA